MPHYIAERLKPEDASFLLFESPNAHMHLSWVWIFTVGPHAHRRRRRHRHDPSARGARGCSDFPRFRQRLAWTPVEGHPAWVDDETFKLRYHVQHAALPDPGRRDAAAASPRSRSSRSRSIASKPLWELWVIEGLPDGRFARRREDPPLHDGRPLDGDLMNGLLDRDAARPRPEEAADWIPRPAPGPEALLRDGARRARAARRAGAAGSRRAGSAVAHLARGGRDRRRGRARSGARTAARDAVQPSDRAAPHGELAARCRSVDLERAALRLGLLGAGARARGRGRGDDAAARTRGRPHRRRRDPRRRSGRDRAPAGCRPARPAIAPTPAVVCAAGRASASAAGVPRGRARHGRGPTRGAGCTTSTSCCAWQGSADARPRCGARRAPPALRRATWSSTDIPGRRSTQSICSMRASSRPTRWCRCSTTRASASRSRRTMAAITWASSPTGRSCRTSRP